MARAECEGHTSRLLVLLLVVTMQVCVVAAEEPVLSGTDGGEISLELLQEEAVARSAPIPATAVSGANAPPGPPTMSKSQIATLIKEHTSGRKQAKEDQSSAKTKRDQRDKDLDKHREKMQGLISQFEHASVPLEANRLERQINDTKADLERDTQDKTAQIEKIALSKEKEEYHQAELKRLNVIPVPSPQAIARKVAKKLARAHKKQTENLNDHIKFNAIQAKNLAFQNKELLDKISAHTDDVALAKEKIVLQNKLTKLHADLVAAKQEKQSANNAQAASDAEAKISALGTQIPEIQTQLSAMDKPVNKEEDPIMSLTPHARLQVLEVRGKIKEQKVAMEDKVSKYDEDLANLDQNIKDKQQEVAQESDPVKLEALDKQLSDWEVAKVDMTDAHTKGLAAEKAKLEKLEKQASDLLVGNPATTGGAAEGPDFAAKIEEAEGHLDQVREASSALTEQLAKLEQVGAKHALAQALMTKLQGELETLEKEHAAEPSADKALVIKQKIVMMKAKKKTLQEKLDAATSDFNDAKEVNNKRQKQLMYAQQTAKSRIEDLQVMKSDALNADDFKDTESAVEGMMTSLERVEAKSKQEVEDYDKAAEEAADKASQASAAVEVAMNNAETIASEVTALTEQVASEEEPEILKALKTKLAAAKKEEEEAQTKLKQAEDNQRAVATAVLNVEGGALKQKEDEMAKLVAGIKAAREALKDKKAAANKAVLEAAKEDTPEKLQAKKDADAAVVEAENAVKDLEKKENNLKELIEMFKVKGEEQDAKKKEEAAEAKEGEMEKETDKQTAKALEAKSSAQRLKSENEELKTRLEKLEAKLEPDQKEMADKEVKAAMKMKEELEAKDAKIAYAHAVENMQHSDQKATRLKGIIKSETQGITSMKIRLRKLDAIQKKTLDESTAKHLSQNIKEETGEEKRQIGALREHVMEESKAEKSAAGYRKALETATARRQAALKKIEDREKAAEEKKAKAEAMETVRERARAVANAEMEKKKLENDIKDKQEKLKELETSGAPAEDIKAAEKALSEVTGKEQAESTTAKVMKLRTAKAQMASIKVQAMEPLAKAKTEHKAIELRLAARRKDVDLFRSKLNDLAKNKILLARKLIETKDEQERLELHTEIAKNTGLSQAAQMNLEEATKRAAVIEKQNTQMIQEVAELEKKRDEVVAEAPAEMRQQLAEKALVKAQEQAKLNAETEAEKAAAAEAEAKRKAEMAGHTGYVDQKVSKILARSKKVADSAPLPAPPPPPVGKWEWHGPEPADGEKPPQPGQSQVEQLKSAAAQSAANLKDGSLVKSMAAAQTANMDDANDKADIAALDAKIDKEQTQSNLMDAKDDSQVSTAVNNAALAKAVVTKQSADAAVAQQQGQIEATEAPKRIAAAAAQKVVEKNTAAAAVADKSATAQKVATHEAADQAAAESQATEGGAAPSNSELKKSGAPKLLLDQATNFLQEGKWVWNGDVPDTGKPEVPRYMRVAAGEKVDPKPVPVMATPDVGPVAEAMEEKSEAQHAAEEASAIAATLRADVNSLINKLAKATAVQMPSIEKQLSSKKVEYHAAKQRMIAAQQALDTDRMKLQETKVGAGKEDPDKAIEKVKAEKDAMAERSLKAAKDKVAAEKEKKVEAEAKAEETKQTEKEMKKLDQSSSSPAVKKAAESMESKESDQELQQEQEKIDADTAEKNAEVKMKAEQSEEGKDVEKTNEAAEDAKKQADMAKKAAKLVFDFEGRKYEKAVKHSGEHQLAAAKLNALWHKLDKEAKITTSASKAKHLKKRVILLKKDERQQMRDAETQKQLSQVAVVNQHRIAQDLDHKLAGYVADAISGKEEVLTPQEAEAKQVQEIAKDEAGQEADDLKVLKERVIRLRARLSMLQQKRLDDEKNVKNSKEQEKAVAQNPIPELPKGVKEEVPKGVKAIEKAKEKSLRNQASRLKDEAKATAKEELHVAMELEKAKNKVAEVTAKVEELSEKATTADQAVEEAEAQKTEQKYGPKAMQEKSKQQASKASAERVMQKMALKSKEMAAGPSEEEKEEKAAKEEEREAEGQPADDAPKPKTKSIIEKKIVTEKNAVSDIQAKLKVLRAKISQPVLEQVEAGGDAAPAPAPAINAAAATPAAATEAEAGAAAAAAVKPAAAKPTR